MLSSAKFSPDGRYRYWLTRTVALKKKFKDREGFTAVFIMVNPSTADAFRDDQTIKKVVGFARKYGWNKVIVVNLFAYRATRVKELATVRDPVGEENDDYIRRAFEKADIIVAAWGRSSKFPPFFRGRYLEVCNMVPSRKKLHSLGDPCQDGHPKHPLTLPYAHAPQQWSCK